MRFLILTLASYLAGMLLPISLGATSIVPFSSLGEATTYSECVVLARAVESVQTLDNGTTYQDMRFEALESIKGPLLTGSVFSLRPYSRQTGDFRIDITGDFKPESGKSYLLFLSQKDGIWRPIMLSYYVFEQFQSGTDKFLVPLGGEGLEPVNHPDGHSIEPLATYDQDILLQQLHACSSAYLNIWDGNKGRSALKRNEWVATDRAVPTGCDFKLGGPTLSRWQNPAIPIYYDDNSNPTNWASIFSNVLLAMKSNYTGIDPSDAGSKAYTPNCVGGSAIGGNFIDYCNANLGGAQCALIIFEDPCNEIPDLNGCSGTLAFGGSYSSSNTHQFDGMSWDNALYGFLVVNNGVEACLTDLQYERMVTHELTHAYRMGHLNATDYPNQNMNPICCNAINTKDEECMNYAYPAPAPVELISFEARLQANRQVSLLWKTATEKDNAYFSIQHSANGIQFEEIKRVQGAGTNGKEYEWIDTRPLAGINYYLLSQTDLDGTIHHLGIKAVNLENKSLSLNISPNPVMGETLAFGIDIQTEFDGIMEVVNTHGLIISSTSLVLEKGIQRLQQPIGTIPAGIYLLRLINGQQFWTARFLKE